MKSIIIKIGIPLLLALLVCGCSPNQLPSWLQPQEDQYYDPYRQDNRHYRQGRYQQNYPRHDSYYQDSDGSYYYSPGRESSPGRYYEDNRDYYRDYYNRGQRENYRSGSGNYFGNHPNQ